jgi:CheY-like chemotaxis protein
MTPHVKQILCVDDEEDTCSMLRSLLGIIDCHATTVTTAAEALELIARERFDLYLLDNWLPGGSGVELCRKIRQSDKSTPIVFYSGAGLESEREEALAAGAQVYLVKPDDLAALVETVRRLLP